MHRESKSFSKKFSSSLLYLAAALLSVLSIVSVKEAHADRELSGSFEVEVVDKVRGRPEYRYYLREQKNAVNIPLALSKKAAEIVENEGHYFARKGMRVKIRTSAKSLPNRSEALLMHRYQQKLEVNEISADTNSAPAAALQVSALATPTGVHRIASLIVNIHTGSGTKNSVGTAASINSILMTAANNVNGLYQEASYGLLSITNTTFGPYTIESSNLDCDANLQTWETAARAKAAAAGVDLSGYDHVLFFLPSYTTLGCAWAGRGYMPGSTVMLTNNTLQTIAHEMGHNLGFNHASMDANNDGVIPAADEYADISCEMGTPFNAPVHFNGVHKAQAGWIYSLGNAVREYTARGTYTTTLSALEYNPTTVPNPQLIIARPPINDKSYYLSFRQDMGTYSRLTTAGGIPNKVHIERYGSGTQRSYGITALAAGGTYYDAHLGFRFTVTAITASTATVRVEIGEGDLDNDGIRDDSDPDDDNDGTPDVSDCAMYDNTKWRNQAYPDPDRDTIRNSTTMVNTPACFGTTAGFGYTNVATAIDNCPTVYNYDQLDSDGDGKGNACDDVVPTYTGDYDLSGCVDQADYNYWRANFGNVVPTRTGADGSGNGVIDAGDYTIWRNNLGNHCPTS